MSAVYAPSRLAVLRKRAGLSQEQVAAELGRNQNHVSRLESGEYSVQPVVETLARLYGVTPDQVRAAAPARRKT